MVRAGPGVFYDGSSSTRHSVSVELERAGLVIRAAEGHLLARWPYGELEHLSAHAGMLRLGRLDSPLLARLEVHDPELAHAIDELAHTVDRTGGTERRGRTKVVAWSIAAVVSLVLVGVFGVPAIADRLTPYVPVTAERKLGEAVDPQVRSVLGVSGKPDCGEASAEKSGRAALDRLVAPLETAAGLELPLRVAVLRHPQANAIALPGGLVYVFEGLVAKAQTPDEIAGVIAHEIGHVAHRDGTRAVLQAAGFSFLFGMVLGDFVGGGAVVIARHLLQLSYSREVERRADAFGVDLMQRIGGDPRALGAILVRIEGANHPGMAKLLLDHPDTKDRLAAINTAPAVQSATTLLTPAEWAALKRVCVGP